MCEMCVWVCEAGRTAACLCVRVCVFVYARECVHLCVRVRVCSDLGCLREVGRQSGMVVGSSTRDNGGDRKLN